MGRYQRRLGAGTLEEDAARLRPWVGAPGGAGAAPNDAKYLTLAADGDLTQERVFTPGDGLAGTDAGAGSTYTLDVDLVAAWSGLEFNAGDLRTDLGAAHAWTALHSFAAGITFNGASDANEITIPDNTAIAFELEDAGGLEYLRIVSTNAQPVINFNSAAADVDFHVEASGVADALQVRGLDGQITLGALGAGYVSADAGGVLSSAGLPGSFTGFANPTASVGLSAVNGAATTAMRSDGAPALDQGIVPTWSALHTFSAGITLNGASGANDITVPDNVAIATQILDAGATEYLRIISTDAQPVVYFNYSGQDIDFSVEAIGVPDAIFIRGSDGQTTLGVLGAGVVQSTAAGVLSSSTATSDGATNHSTILSSSAAGAITMDDYFTIDGGTFGISGNELLTVKAAGSWAFTGSNVLIDPGGALAAPDGTLHVHTATAGAVVAHADADDLIIENSGNVGISLLSPAANYGSITWGSPTDNFAFTMAYDHTSGILGFAHGAVPDFGIATDTFLVLPGSNISMSDGSAIGILGNELITFDAAGYVAVTGANFGLGLADPAFLLHLDGLGIAAAFQRTSATITNGNALAVLTFMGTESGGGATSEHGAQIIARADGTWAANDAPGRLEFLTTLDGTDSPAIRMTIKNDGNVGIATANPGQIFDVNQGSGNMIADGYDTHSLGEYKEDLTPITGAGMIDRLKSFNLYEWTRTVFISTHEVVMLAVAHFRLETDNLFDPRTYYAGLAVDSPVRIWIDARRVELQAERANLPEWTRKHSGLVADDKDTQEALGDVIGYDGEGKPTGYSVTNYVGFLHGVALETVSVVQEMEITIAALTDRVRVLEAARVTP